VGYFNKELFLRITVFDTPRLCLGYYLLFLSGKVRIGMRASKDLIKFYAL
jgi:hypothetical protein